MLICQVVGNVWATKKEESLTGKKMMIVRRADEHGSYEKGECFVAADIVGAGIGEQVLVVNGSTARTAMGDNAIPVDAVIVGIIDSLEIKEE